MGQRILRELNLAESNKTLVRWMAHRIAELMERSEGTADDSVREQARRECADLILRLWSQRREWPDAAPLSEILRVLGMAAPQEHRVRFLPEKPPSNWFDALVRLEKLQDEEARTCWEAAILQIDQQQLSDELARAEPFAEDLNNEEREIYDLLLYLRDHIAEQVELLTLTLEQQTKHFAERLAKIHQRRATLFAEVSSSPISLQQAFGTDQLDEPSDKDV